MLKMPAICIQFGIHTFLLSFAISHFVCVCFFKLVFVCARFFYVYFYLLQAIYYPNNYRAEYLLLSMRDTIFIP